MHKLDFTPNAAGVLESLKQDRSRKNILKAVQKTLAFLETNLRHPSLRTHEYCNFKGPKGEKVFEAYAQQNTPGAYRVLWYYGPTKNTISVIAIIPHP